MGGGNNQYDLIVIGSGPGGYTAALHAAKLGAKTALIEKADVGGVCLNWGCIPTKAILHSAALYQQTKNARRYGISVDGVTANYPGVVKFSRQTVTRLVKGLTGLIEKSGIDLIRGAAVLAEPTVIDVKLNAPDVDGAVSRRLSAKHLILATGGAARGLPGVAFDGEKVISSREAIVQDQVPARLMIVGAGAIGLEFAEIYATFGAKVTVVEMLDRVLPLEDEEVSAVVRTALLKKKIKIHTGTMMKSLAETADGLSCQLAPVAGGDPLELSVDQVLVAIGVGPVSEGMGLESAGVATDHGFISVDEHLRTSAAGVYAIGDVTGAPQLAHAASAKGIYAVEHALGKTDNRFKGDWIPGAVFTHPQVASVGRTEAALTETGTAYKVGRFPFSASGKAVAEGEIAGFVKVLLCPETGKLLGAHIVGHNASELITSLTLAATHGLTGAQIMQSIHTHPTLSEAIPEAVGDALGLGIHV
jgi:dihydrolipoyl dehydrogenase